MTVYVEVAEALVASGYLSGADARAAVAVLVDTMRIADVKHQEIVAADDIVALESAIAEAKAEAAAATEAGNQADAERQRKIIDGAKETLEQDREIIADARRAIAIATSKAADALVAAGLVDAAHHEDVIEIIGHARW
jgi:hypothetical protein